jgi:plastocyanin
MRPRGNRNRILAAALALAVVLTFMGGIGAIRPAGARITPTAGTSTLDVTAANGYAFSPNEFQQVPTNATITVTFTDATPLGHTFSIIGREGWVVPSSADANLLDQLAYGHAPPAIFNINVSGSGDRQTGTFTSPGPGWYEFVCTQGGHFAYGMYGFIAFGMNLPSNLTIAAGEPGPGAAIFIIAGSIVALVVIALVLGFVVGRREGAKHEMPPERLGYAEPPASGGAPLPTPADDHRN